MKVNVVKLRELVEGMRAALAEYDSASVPCAAPCKLCAAIAVSRDHLRGLEQCLEQLEADERGSA